MNKLTYKNGKWKLTVNNYEVPQTEWLPTKLDITNKPEELFTVPILVHKVEYTDDLMLSMRENNET